MGEHGAERRRCARTAARHDHERDGVMEGVGRIGHTHKRRDMDMDMDRPGRANLGPGAA